MIEATTVFNPINIRKSEEKKPIKTSESKINDSPIYDNNDLIKLLNRPLTLEYNEEEEKSKETAIKKQSDSQGKEKSLEEIIKELLESREYIISEGFNPNPETQRSIIIGRPISVEKYN